MADATISTKIKLDGEAEYKQRISEINAALGALDSKLKLLNATYAGNESSVKGLTEINEVLNQKILTQRDKVEQLQEMLKQSAAAYGESDTTTQKYQQQLNNAEAVLVKMERTLAENTAKLKEAGGEADNFSDGLKDLADRTGETEQALVDTKAATGNLGDVVNGLTQKLGIQLPDGMKSSMNAMGSLDASSLALAGTFAAVAAAIVKVEKAMISMTKESASFADNIITLSMQTGQTTDQLQEFSYATELIDVSVDTLQGSLRKLTNNMQDAMNGTGNAKDAFDTLGVSVTNTVDGSLRSANDVFYETIDALGQVKNETERDAMSMDIFGRSAQDLNPLIIQGSDTLKAYAEEAHNVGYVLDNDALSALGAVDDAYQRLQKTQEGVKNQLAVEFAPYLEEFYGDATQGVKDLGKAIKDSGIVDAFGMLLETVGDILNPMSDLSGNRVPALTNALRPLAEVMALIADTADFFAGLFTLDFKKMGNALGFGYASGNGNKYQTLQDSYAAKSWGSSASDLSKAYEDAIARGDSSTIGITEDEWVRRYMGGNAAGTDNWSGGWTRVNENGLERIYLPSGSRIQTASETRYTGGGDIYIDKVIIPASDIRELNDIVTIFTNERITQRMGAK